MGFSGKRWPAPQCGQKIQMELKSGRETAALGEQALLLEYAGRGASDREKSRIGNRMTRGIHAGWQRDSVIFRGLYAPTPGGQEEKSL
jgi:hypothetical protein